MTFLEEIEKNPALGNRILGLAADRSGNCVSVIEAAQQRRKIVNRVDLGDDEWREITIASIRAGLKAEPLEGQKKKRHFSVDRQIIDFPQALQLVQNGAPAGYQIIDSVKASLSGLIDLVSKELGESCEAQPKVLKKDTEKPTHPRQAPTLILAAGILVSVAILWIFWMVGQVIFSIFKR